MLTSRECGSRKPTGWCATGDHGGDRSKRGGRHKVGGRAASPEAAACADGGEDDNNRAVGTLAVGPLFLDPLPCSAARVHGCAGGVQHRGGHDLDERGEGVAARGRRAAWLKVGKQIGGTVGNAAATRLSRKRRRPETMEMHAQGGDSIATTHRALRATIAMLSSGMSCCCCRGGQQRYGRRKACSKRGRPSDAIYVTRSQHGPGL